MSSGTAMARLQRGAAGTDGGNDEAAKGKKDKEKSENSSVRTLNSGTTTAGGGGGGSVGGGDEGGAGGGGGVGVAGTGGSSTTTTTTTTATAIKANTVGSVAPRAPPATANTTVGGGGSSHGGGATNTTTTSAAATTAATTGNNNNQAPPRGKRCCFLWCCCCRCSCLNAKTADELRFRKQDLYNGDNEPQPTIEEIRAWSESFEKLMTCASGRKAFRDFLKLEFSEENILFWLACEDLKVENNPAVIEEKARIIYEDYISILSPKEVSLDSRVREIINRNMVDPTPHTFDEAQTQIYTLMHRDSYPRFINSAIYKRLAQLNNNGSSGSSRKESAT